MAVVQIRYLASYTATPTKKPRTLFVCLIIGEGPVEEKMRASFVHTVFPDELVNLSKRDERFSFVYFHQFGFSAGNVMMNVTGYCCTHL